MNMTMQFGVYAQKYVCMYYNRKLSSNARLAGKARKAKYQALSIACTTQYIRATTKAHVRAFFTKLLALGASDM